MVMHFFSAVKAENYIMTFFVCKFNYIVINKHTVCCKCKTEVFVVFLFNASCIGNNLLYNVKVHKRFSAEEVSLFKVKCKVFVLVVCKELSLFLKLFYIINAVWDFFFCNLRIVCIFWKHFVDYLFFCCVFVHCNNIISKVIDCVYTAAVNIKNYVVSVKFILMNHNISVRQKESR